MLIKVTDATRKRLMQKDYKLVKEWSTDSQHKWPDDPPEKKNHLVLVPYDTRYAEEFFITSTRVITIGRELPGGAMGERYGIVCGKDDRGRSQFVLGGGKVQPDFDTGNADRLIDRKEDVDKDGREDCDCDSEPGYLSGRNLVGKRRDGKFEEDRELVRGAIIAENREELNIVFASKDRYAYNNFFLFGVRAITDKNTDPETQITETVQKKINGLSVGDACFLAITHERLGYFKGQKGETRERHVKPASELMGELSMAEREHSLPMLPYAQATALAMAITAAKEIFEDNMPPALAEIVADGENWAHTIVTRSSSYVKHFSKVIQEGAWEV